MTSLGHLFVLTGVRSSTPCLRGRVARPDITSIQSLKQPAFGVCCLSKTSDERSQRRWYYKNKFKRLTNLFARELLLKLKSPLNTSRMKYIECFPNRAASMNMNIYLLHPLKWMEDRLTQGKLLKQRTYVLLSFFHD